MRIAFLLHLYQPENQDPAIVKEIAERSYLPLIKLIKKTKNAKFTLNIQLSLLAQLEKLGYTSWINDVRDLVNQEKVELVGSAAYHPLLTKLPKSLRETEIILQEYGLGYYFGSHTGFEGENAIMVKNIRGFFPPEMAINEEVLDDLSSLGYDWVIVDENALAHLPTIEGSVYRFGSNQLSLVVRNNSLSTYLAFMRDSDATLFVNSCLESQEESAVIALDGETFGHHNKQGISLLDSIIFSLQNSGISLHTVSELVSSADGIELSSVLESTWGSSKEEMQNGIVYPMWDVSGNETHALQWELFNALVADSVATVKKDVLGYENIKLWDSTSLLEIDDVDARKEIEKHISVLKLLSSDPFWWASKKKLPDGSTLYHPTFIKNFNKNVVTYVNNYCEDAVIKRISGIIDQLNELLD